MHLTLPCLKPLSHHSILNLNELIFFFNLLLPLVQAHLLRWRGLLFYLPFFFFFWVFALAISLLWFYFTFFMASIVSLLLIWFNKFIIYFFSLLDCPLEFTWANFTSAGSACNDPSQLSNCCRYINAYVAISVARYANSTGKLGVPPAFSDLCFTAVAETFQFYGIPLSATESCGVGPKIRVTYQCDGRGTVLEMMQSPGFTEVISNCQVWLQSYHFGLNLTMPHWYLVRLLWY